jgi:3-oxoacyl-[acyl-carrier-protein] synthase-3
MLIETGVCRKIILLVGDTTTKMINNKDRSVKMVFGDAGTATLIDKGNTSIGLNMKVDGMHYNQLIIPAGGYRYPSSNLTARVLEVEDNNRRSKEDLFMDGMGILKFAITEVPPLISEILEMAHWKDSDIQTYAIHQANEFMVNYLRKTLKLEKSQVPINVERFGNTGPSSIPLLLCSLGDELKKQNKLERVLMCGFGVGLSWGAAYTNLTLCNFIKPFDYEGR